MAKHHRCGGRDCPVCERIAEERADRFSRAAEEYLIRRDEDRYEEQLFGKGL